jgi:hypothetical protein
MTFEIRERTLGIVEQLNNRWVFIQAALSLLPEPVASYMRNLATAAATVSPECSDMELERVWDSFQEFAAALPKGPAAEIEN